MTAATRATMEGSPCACLPWLAARQFLHFLQTRQQRQRVVAIDGGAHGDAERIFIEFADAAAGVYERIIAAIKDVRGGKELQHGGELRGAFGAGSIAIKALQFVFDTLGVVGLEGFARPGMGDARRQKRQRAATVRKNEADFRAARQHAIQHQAGDGARRVEWELDVLRDQTGDERRRAAMHGGMHIDDGFAAIEFLEHGQKRGIA